MRIFVTGGSGYIGRSVVAELRRRGHHVAALVRSDVASATVRALGAEPVHGSLDASRFVVIFERGGRVSGVLGFSEARRVMQYRRMIAERASFEAALEFAAAAAG